MFAATLSDTNESWLKYINVWLYKCLAVACAYYIVWILVFHGNGTLVL